ncbi:hypothetical protein [Trichormus azollae]|jgi:hypothetical protein|uniref:hypothetical protein n=1 Tax=Trichormus azollae TaxID=1164 RepID=UPI00019579EB|nr:hypothetical protein [Trichormus azollae]
MNAIARLEDKPHRCALIFEDEIFPEEVIQLLYGKSKNVHRVLFTIRDTIQFEILYIVSVLYARHAA